jgi:glycosyltransferase involved in cell wall biosynthesis
MKVLHIGLMVKPNHSSGLSQALADICELTELPTSTPDLNAVAVDIATRLNPDIIFIQVQRENILLKETFEALSGISHVINWTGDVRSPIPQWYVDVAPFVTTAFSNMTNVREFRAKGYNAEYLQIGIDATIYNTHGLKIKTAPVIFMGNNYGNMFPLSKFRLEAVNNLKSEFGESFHVWGVGHKTVEAECNDSQPLEASIYRGAKIGINISHFAYERYFSDRMIRMAACGMLIITHHYPDIEKDWDINNEVVVFHDTKDLIDKTRYYLENPFLAEKIGKQAAKRCMNDYTFYMMATNILKLHTV